MKKIFLRSGLLFLLLGVGGLSSQVAWSSGSSVMDRIQAADKPFDNMKIETAHQLPAKTVLSKESYQGGSFRVLARKDSITKFPCGTCHTDKKVQVTDGALFTHGDIEMNHGTGENRLACIECHDKKNRDVLSDAEGKKIDFDHSYQLCGQCHFRQKRDWLGGAHGKRVAYWAGERVVRNCTSCHSPHSPAFKTKMPETYSLPLDQ
jgi:hypothetical protein